jgi:hypothetical protein
MDKKLSDLWLEQKKYIDLDAMCMDNIKIYGRIVGLEALKGMFQGSSDEKYYKSELLSIAKFYKITGYWV